MSILSLSSVTKEFRIGKRNVKAIDNVSFNVTEGECLGIVGESGSGKSTLANMILGLFPPTKGIVTFRGTTMPARRTLAHRRQIQLVQQNPLSALNPRRSVGASLRLALDVHNHGKPAERSAMVAALLAEVGLEPDIARRAPSGMSGGQRQRIAIARALACQSQIVVLDEPTSALDVLVQARVLRLLDELRKKRGLTYLFITHDLSVVRNIADRVAVFQHVKLIEMAATGVLFSAPQTDYTRSLISSVPVVSSEEIALRDALAL